MDFGFSTRAYYGSGWGLSEIAAHINQNASVMELWVEPPYLPSWRTSSEKSDLERLGEVLMVRDVHLTMHAPKYDLNLASLNPSARKATRQDFRKCLNWANLLDAEILTIHPGSFVFEKEKHMEILVTELEMLDKFAGDFNVILCIENLGKPKTLCQTGLELKNILDGLENIFLTIDFAHLNLVGENPESFIDLLGDKIKHVHISDIKSDGAKHLPLGLGDIDFAPGLLALKNSGFSGYFVMEGEMKNPIDEVESQCSILYELLADAGFNH